MTSYPMIEWARDLYPICRSLTGDGVRQTVEYLRQINPDLTEISFATGEKVFDWEVPREWAIHDCYIEHESGRRFAQFKDHNLHVVGYSTPIDAVMSRDELLPYIYTQPDQPDLIPYVTSYYKERWGFCMSQNEKDALPDGQYKVVIASELFDGELLVFHDRIQGESDQEIFFSSYICHPSMVNNELSGPVVATALNRFIKEEIKSPHYSYRFVLVPETIGSIAYMSRHLDEMKANIFCGFNLSCVGDERAFSHVQSRFGDSISDRALEAALEGRDNVVTYPFLDRGSDERQYCAPGIDLPLSGFCRTKYGRYPEYHTSADDFDVVTQDGLQGAFEVMTSVIRSFEMGQFPRSTVLGEPQLGKRGLYPTISRKGQASAVRDRMNFLAYCDGRTSVFEIAKICHVPLDTLLDEYSVLLESDLIEPNRTPFG